jgi:FkbM family methyltransferase
MGAIHFSLDPHLVQALKRSLPLVTFVETGTYRGDTTAAMSPHFEKVYTAELAEELFNKAKSRFEKTSNVDVIHGSSPEILSSLSGELANQSVLYWLDAHWCGGETDGRVYECPLIAEIGAIGSLNDQSVVLIDDARFFIAPPPAPHAVESWPMVAEVVQALAGLSDKHRLWIINDVFVFAPESAASDVVTYGRAFGVDLDALQRTATARVEAANAPPAPVAAVRSFNQTVELDQRSERLFAFHLRRLAIDRVLDVGGNGGQFASKLRKHGYDGVICSVEPQSAVFPDLLAHAENDLRWLVAPRQGVGDADGYVSMNISENGYSSSILEVHSNHLRAEPATKTVSHETVYVARAAELLRPEAMKTFSAIKIDVQGYEKHVLQGLSDCISNVDLLLLEMSLVECYSGSPMYFELDEFIRTRLGFTPVSLEPSYYDHAGGFAQQVDGIYVRSPAQPARPASPAGVQISAVLTSVGGSTNRTNLQGSDIGESWFHACRRSWRKLGAPVISVSESAQADPEITWIQTAKRPSVLEILREARDRTDGHILLLNSDIMLTDSLVSALQTLSGDVVYYGGRHDVRENPQQQGTVKVTGAYRSGFDIFILPRAFLDCLLSDSGLLDDRFLIGQPWWDYILPVAAHALGFPVKKFGPKHLFALHYPHEEKFSRQKWTENGRRFVGLIKKSKEEEGGFARGILDELLASSADLDKLSAKICSVIP